MKLSDFTALTFDVYGTLIDWESGMIAGLQPLTDQVPGLTRDAILEAHAYHESTLQAWTPEKRYSDILALVYRRLAEDWGVEVDWDACQTYGASVANWPAFPDSVEALAYLKSHFKLFVLTNTDNASFAASNARLKVTFDGVYTAEDVGSYKPNARNFDYMLEALNRRDIAAASVLHTAESMFHDHVPATRAGLTKCWIYRRHAQSGFGATRDPGDLPDVEFQFTSLAEMVEAHEAETR